MYRKAGHLENEWGHGHRQRHKHFPKFLSMHITFMRLEDKGENLISFFLCTRSQGNFEVFTK